MGLELDDKIREIVGHCPVCDADPAPHFTEEVKKGIVELDALHQKEEPSLAKHIRNIEVGCPRCIWEAETKTRGEMWRKRVRLLRRRTYQAELIPAIGKEMTFAKSLPEIEKLNYTAWTKFYKPDRLQKNVWFYGDPGTGKTFFARAILNGQIERITTVAEISALRVNEIGRGWNPTKDLEKYVHVKVLLLEDIDKATWSKEGLSALWSLIDVRATSGSRVIVTSNLHPREVSKQMRLVSKDNLTLVNSMFERLLPMDPIEMIGKSLRREEVTNDGIRKMGTANALNGSSKDGLSDMVPTGSALGPKKHDAGRDESRGHSQECRDTSRDVGRQEMLPDPGRDGRDELCDDDSGEIRENGNTKTNDGGQSNAKTEDT